MLCLDCSLGSHVGASVGRLTERNEKMFLSNPVEENDAAREQALEEIVDEIMDGGEFNLLSGAQLTLFTVYEDYETDERNHAEELVNAVTGKTDWLSDAFRTHVVKMVEDHSEAILETLAQNKLDEECERADYQFEQMRELRRSA